MTGKRNLCACVLLALLVAGSGCAKAPAADVPSTPDGWLFAVLHRASETWPSGVSSVVLSGSTAAVQYQCTLSASLPAEAAVGGQLADGLREVFASAPGLERVVIVVSTPVESGAYKPRVAFEVTRAMFAADWPASELLRRAESVRWLR